MANITPEQYQAAKAKLHLITLVILETIKETSVAGAPLGLMYAAVMNVASYETFMSIISGLEAANQIRVSNHVAYYVGDLHHG